MKVQSVKISVWLIIGDDTQVPAFGPEQRDSVVSMFVDLFGYQPHVMLQTVTFEVPEVDRRRLQSASVP